MTGSTSHPSAVRAPSGVLAPPVLPGVRLPVQHHTPMDSYQTSDLREEINHR
jgi:hypothetical protein